MKVGILGGSFNPPHFGHKYISNEAIKKLRLNQVWWVPTIQNPLKSYPYSKNYEQRFQDCINFTNDSSRIYVKKIKYIYAIDLLDILFKRNKNIKFYWIMGADNIENLHRWHNYRLFISLIKIAIFARDGKLKLLRKSKNWHFLKKNQCLIFNTKQIDISSTKIRNCNA